MHGLTDILASSFNSGQDRTGNKKKEPKVVGGRHCTDIAELYLGIGRENHTNLQIIAADTVLFLCLPLIDSEF